jgi:ketosteroid isomerase-like protein
MKLTMWMKTTLAESMRMTKGILALTLAALFIAPIAMPRVAGAEPETGPTEENALAAVQEFARAMRDNDADGIARCLSDDWAVISARGGVGEGKSVFPNGIKSGYLTRKTYELSEPRVRLHGDSAVVTTKVHMSGVSGGKPFEAIVRETDVLVWRDGSWKDVLTHETFEGNPPPRQ